jgi:uncharacterized membrane protein YgcG
MTTASFEKNNLNWQIQQFGRELSEWIELQTAKFSPPSNNSNPSPMPQFELASWVVELIFWVVVVLAGAWVLWQLYRWLSPYIDILKAQAGWRGADRPVSPNASTVADWLRRVKEQQQQGNYPEACRALYMAMLQRLNDTNQIAHQSSRTDGEYLQLVQQLPRSQSYQTLLQTHEQLCFGEETVSADTFEHCQQAYREIAES